MTRHSALRLAHLRIVRLEARVAALAAELEAHTAGGRPWRAGPAGVSRRDAFVGTLWILAVLIVIVGFAMALMYWGTRG